MLSDKMYRTTNGGANWNFVMDYSLFYSRKPFYFVNENAGWFTDSDVIMKTTNSGLNWITQISSNGQTFSTFSFINENTGWCGSGYSFGGIYKTTNGGTNWFLDNHLNISPITAVHFINSNTGWAVGDDAIVLKTTTGGSIGIQQVSTTVPDKFYLQQNYPNPFNPVTNIKFSLPEKSFVKLKVFDLLGREVQHLVNEKLTAGEYKYDFNASLLPSGIYFYKLETENFSETRKMILVK